MMEKKKLVLLLLLLPLTIFAQKREIIAYYPSWGAPQQRYYVKNIETSGSGNKITILNYAFVEPAPDSTGKIVAKFMSTYFDYGQPYSALNSIDGVADDSAQPLRGQFNQLKKLKKMHPGLRILVSIGGWTGSTYFSDAARSPQSREVFVNDCINKFILGNLPKENYSGGEKVGKGIFDGFDLDWEFPIEGGVDGIHHDVNDRDNFSELISLFRNKLHSINPKLLLTSAVPAGITDHWKFNYSKDQAKFDWYNLMTYDFHGSWDTISNHHTNLLGKQSFVNTIRFFLDSLGINSKKIVPGAAFYGRGWKVRDTINCGLYRPGVVANGILEPGFNSYRDLNVMLKNGYRYKWDDTAMAPWLFNPADSVIWTYDDMKSISLKVHCTQAYNLRGIMFWDISGDDSTGSLVETIYKRNMQDIPNQKKYLAGSLLPVNVTLPVADDQVRPGSDIILKTNIPETDSSVLKVEFFSDKKSLGYVTEFPFNWVWYNIPSGRHTLKLVTTYSNLIKKSSPGVVVNIK